MKSDAGYPFDGYIAITNVKRPVHHTKIVRQPIQCLALAFKSTLISSRRLGECHVYDLEEQMRGQCSKSLPVVGPTARKWRWGDHTRCSVGRRGNHTLFVKDDHGNECLVDDYFLLTGVRGPGYS